jgi:hypothetical protein
MRAREKKMKLLIFISLAIIFTSCTNEEFAPLSVTNLSIELPPELPQDPQNPQDNNPNEPQGPQFTWVEENFTQNGEESHKVDILWVIDNSGSMGNDQANLAANFASYADTFWQLGQEIDVRMMVTSTDPRSSSSVGDGKLRSFKGTNYLSNVEVDEYQEFVTDFQSRVLLGVNGYHIETYLLSAYRALSRPENKALLREDAITIINFLGDERDSSLGTIFEIFENAESYVNAIKSSIEGKSRKLVINSIVETTGKYGVVGADQILASELTGGTTHSIRGNFADSLTNLGEAMVELADSFVLQGLPSDPSTMVVKVDGVEVAKNHWSYNLEQNTLRFEDNHLPANGSIINIGYSVVND